MAKKCPRIPTRAYAEPCSQIPTKAYAEPCSTGQKRGQKSAESAGSSRRPFFHGKNEPKWPKNVRKSLREHMQSHARRAKNEVKKEPNLPEASGKPFFMAKNKPKRAKSVLKSLREHAEPCSTGQKRGQKSAESAGSSAESIFL